MAADTELEAERDAALVAVRRASSLCRRVQGRLVAGETLTKGDESPVTVADFAAQAVVVEALTERLGDIDLVGEEDPGDLESDDQATLRDGVTQLVSHQLERSVSDADVLRWIGVGRSDGSTERFWTLDPIDGTKGFLRGDQYAIALALIERGHVVLGVLGCPNLPNPDGTRGAVFVASDEGCVAYAGAAGAPSSVRVAEPTSLSQARLCESVESGHSDHDAAAEIAHRLGIEAEPYRIDSQCKYAAVARGDASIYLRLPTRRGYREKIWDHAAGMFVVEQAGGTVTDVDGNPLDFRHGRRLEHNRGIVATAGRFHDVVVDVVRDVLNRADSEPVS